MQDKAGNNVSVDNKLDQNKCAGVVFAETSVVSGDATKLAEARRYIAGVAYKRNGAGVAKPIIPNEEELRNPNTRKIWENCVQAAKDAAEDDVLTCKHFVLWYSDDEGKAPSESPKKMKAEWPYEQKDKIDKSWGPFSSPIEPKFIPIDQVLITDTEEQVEKVSNLYIFKYCGVP